MSDAFVLSSCLITLAALFGYLNSRFVRLPTTSAIMAASLLLSGAIILSGEFGKYAMELHIADMLVHLDFNKVLIQGMLSFLLFAGALHIDLDHLRECKWEIISLATVSTIASTFIIATIFYYALPLLTIKLPYIYCLLFGSLISPTDPIAVLAIFKQVGAPRRLNVTVSGESLFNDGVGIVLFITFLGLATSSEAVTWHHVLGLFLQEAVGGIAYGILLGYIGHLMLRSIDDDKVEILLTLAMATGGYVFANTIHVSGPLAMVAAGLFVGNKGQKKSLADFWELIDEVLNAVLFLLMGFELLVIPHHISMIIAGIIAIPVVLLVRFATVGGPLTIFGLSKRHPKGFIPTLVWGGLRGGLAVALALGLPNNNYRAIILTMTYAIVIHAILVQGLTIKKLMQKYKN